MAASSANAESNVILQAGNDLNLNAAETSERSNSATESDYSFFEEKGFLSTTTTHTVQEDYVT